MSIRTLIAALLAIALISVIPIKSTPVKQQLNKQAREVSTSPVVRIKSTATAKAPRPENKTTVAPMAKAEITQPVTKPIVETTYASGCSTYDSLFRQYAWNVQVAEAICQAESGGNPYAVSSTNDFGLMQLHDEEIFNPSANIAGAYQKYLAQGWEAWTTYNTGAYQRFL